MSVRDEEKLRLFTDEVLGEAETAADKINKEVDAEEARLLEEGEHRILAEAYDRIQSELKNLRRENSQTLSRETMLRRRELLLYRDKITRDVFLAAREKLVRFTETEGYGDYLVKLAVDVLAKQSASFTLYLSPRDMKYKYRILEGLDNLLDEKLEMGTSEAAPVYSVTPDSGIKLGGIRFCSAARGITVNATLDDDLAAQKEYFTELLGPLYVTEETPEPLSAGEPGTPSTSGVNETETVGENTAPSTCGVNETVGENSANLSDVSQKPASTGGVNEPAAPDVPASLNETPENHGSRAGKDTDQ